MNAGPTTALAVVCFISALFFMNNMRLLGTFKPISFGKKNIFPDPSGYIAYLPHSGFNNQRFVLNITIWSDI